jgi:site-specific DNA recombinase
VLQLKSVDYVWRVLQLPIKEERITGVLAIYLRLSKEDTDNRCERKEESNSIRTQRLLLRNYISEKEDLKEFEVTEYVDDGYSGKNFERPGIKRLLNDVRKNRIQCIMVKDFSRFGRDYVEVGYYIEKIFPFMGVRFIAVNNHFDNIAMKEGEVPDMDFSFQNLIYDYYSVENSVKTKKVQEKRRQAGKYMAVYAPYGYLKDPQDKNHLIIDEEAAIQVRNIFEWYAKGVTKANIARLLDARGFITPANYMTAKGSSYSWQYKESQGKWSGAIVGRILKNRTYTGTLVSGKTEAIEIGGKRVRYKEQDEWCITENTHQPIISNELFERVQNWGKTMLNNKTDKNKKESNEFSLRGYLRCGGCKHKLTRRKRANVTYYCRYYYEMHNETCLKGSVLEDKILEIVLDVLKKQIILAKETRYLSNLKLYMEQYRERERMASRYVIEEKIKKMKKEDFLRYELFHTGKIEKDCYLEEKRNNAKQLKQLEEKLLRYNTSIENSTNQQKDQTFLDICEQEMIKALLETIEVYPNNRVVIHVGYKSIWSLTPNKRD